MFIIYTVYYLISCCPFFILEIFHLFYNIKIMRKRDSEPDFFINDTLFCLNLLKNYIKIVINFFPQYI